MSDLQNLTPANTYKALLQLGDYTDGISGDTGANALQVSDGAGNNTSLALSTDRVGIGNTSPSAELDVSGDVVADEYALDQTGSSSSAVAIHAPATNELAIRTNSTEAMRIDSEGNVGIGTTDPNLTGLQLGNALVVSSATGGDIVAHKSGSSVNVGDICGALLISNSDTDGSEDHFVGMWGKVASTNGNQDLHFAAGREGYENDTPQMTITGTGGNVGIGTTSPSAPLEVSSTTGGVIMPRMTTTQMNAISSPTDGEMIYNTTANKFYGRANGAWVALH